MALWPFIIVKEKKYKRDVILMNHEHIHLAQQRELALFGFYLWYGIEYVLLLLKFKSHHKAYKNISFEREAYTHEKHFNYLKKRKTWSFFKYSSF